GTEAHHSDTPEPTSLPAAVPDETALLALGDAHILLLSHADTDLLTLNQAAHTLPADFHPVRGVNLSSLPTTSHVDEFIHTELADVQVIILRSLGGRQGFIHGFDRLVQYAKQQNKDLICIPGTEGLDPELTAHSTVPVPVIHDVYRYLHYGGIDNMRQMLYFLADHLLAGGWGFEQPVEQPRHGIYWPETTLNHRQRLAVSSQRSAVEEWLAVHDRSRPTIAILFYRSHWLSGNTDFIDALIDQIEADGGNALPIFTTSLKETTPVPDQTPTSPSTSNSKNPTNSSNAINSMNSTNSPPAAFDYLYTPTGDLIPDVIISTISFAMGGINPDGPTAAGWNVSTLEALNIPILQAISSGMRAEEWQLNQRGLRPLDVAMNVALPEFDGRIITVPISFKGESKQQKNGSTCCGEAVCTCTDDQRSAVSGQRYIPVPDRIRAVINQAMRYAVLRHKPNRHKRIVFMLTNSPGKADRIGNAVGLDTPASLLQLFAAMQAQGYLIENIPASGDALLHELIDRCSYDETLLTESQLSRAAGRVPVETYAGWFDQLTPSQQRRMHDRWQAPPGEAYVHLDAQGLEQHLALAGLEMGNVFVALQPPRCYGMDPDAIYHTPDLPP
ncbi:MAG: cobaltochelatase subunit CobN, partial [Anaerolineae bacterium]|nr:cobaltochelatase subunit CobN [Anaerolineae bacterium]